MVGQLWVSCGQRREEMVLVFEKKTVGSRYLWRLRYDDAKKLRKGQEISAVHIFFWSNSPQIIQIRHLYKFALVMVR